jgi:TP901 family phage tail tape measure protein
MSDERVMILAQRTISTRIAIDGEAQYKQSISNINAELKKYSSALGLVQSEYKSNANSMDALTSKQKALSDLQSTQTVKVKELNAAYKNAQSAVDAYKDRNGELTQKITANEAALEKLKNTEGDTSEEQRKLTEETTKLKSELAENEAKMTAAEKGANNWQTSLNKAQTELNKTNDEIKQNDKYLGEAKNSTDKCAKSIDEFGNKTNSSAKSLDTLSTALVSAGIVQGLKKMADAFVACAEASVAYESAMTGVEKTTDLTDAQLSEMSESFKKLSGVIPVTASDLAGIAENAGQLGIANDYIVKFTATMADLGVATNLSGEEAAQMLAKFANVSGMDEKYYSNLGSAVVALGNNFATTEADIVTMSTRLVSAGTLAGLTEPEILALATAMSSVGIEAEAGGTAMTQTLNAIEKAAVKGGKSLDQFANIAGMSSEEFVLKWKTAPIEAVQAFIAGLGGLEAKGESATLVLDDMGLSGIRQSNMLKSLALASGQLSGAVDLSSTAWQENIALTKEAQTRYGTTESKLKLLDNAFNRVQITVGDQLNPAMQMFIDAGTGVLDWIDDFISENKWVVPIITGITVALGVLTVALIFSSTVVKGTVIPAIKAMTASLMANPVFLVVTAIAALTAALITLVPALLQADEESQKLAENTKALSDEMNSAAEAYEKNSVAADAQAQTTDVLIDRLDELAGKSKLTTAETMLLKGTTKELADMYPELNSLLSDNTAELTKSIPEIKRRVEALNAQQEAEMQRDRIIELQTEQSKAEQQLAENERKRQKILAGLTSEQKKHIYGLSDANMETLSYHSAVMLLDDELREATSSLEELAESDNALGDSLENTTESLALNQEQFDANAETLAKYGMTVDAYNAAADTMNEQQQEQYNQMLLLEGELANLSAAHEVAYNAAYDNINGAIGLFENMELEGEKSIDDLIGSLDTQIVYMDTYGANLKKAMEMAVDEGLVQKLSDGSKESAGILAGIVQGGEDEIKALNEKFGLVEEGKGKFSGVVADMETDFNTNMDAINTKLDGLVKDMNKADTAATAARQTGSSYASGLRSKYTEVYNASAHLAEGANKGWTDYYQQHSPAKRAIDTGAQTADSYAMGIESKTKHIEETTGKFALAANDAYIDKMKEVTIKATPIRYNLSSVSQRQEAPARSRGGNITIQVYGKGMIVRNESDITKISQQLAKEAKRKIAAKGGRAS